MAAASTEHLPSAVRETLDSIVSPELREHILRAALVSAGMNEMPVHPHRFRDFLEGPLRESLLRTLGTELGASLVSELIRVVTTAERDLAAKSSRPSHSPPSVWRPAAAQVHPTMPSPGNTPSHEYELDDPDSDPADQLELRQTDPYSVDYVPGPRGGPGAKGPARSRAITEPAPADLGSDALPPSSANYPLGTANALGVIGTASVEFGSTRRQPLVLVASTNPDLVRCFGAWLDPRATVHRVRTVLSMFQDLAEAGERRVVVVLDAKSPSVRPLSLAAVADDLPPGTRVVLWGVGSDVYAKMLTVSVAVAKWLVCGTESSTSEVVAQCARIVG
ncbi:MAG TPA: hypothetical protein VGP93_00815 [Polyangiaceae bacterium]|jgi:hypothetical protein|nr:hypothetical protein [Polyangiaceae bacterium]